MCQAWMTFMASFKWTVLWPLLMYLYCNLFQWHYQLSLCSFQILITFIELQVALHTNILWQQIYIICIFWSLTHLQFYQNLCEKISPKMNSTCVYVFSDQACDGDSLNITSEGFDYQCLGLATWHGPDNICVLPYSPLYSPHISTLSYNVSVSMFSQGDAGHPSLMYNYIDDNNFDYIMFRSVRKL